MSARQAVPRLWLLTDARQGEALWDALERLPAGSGVVVRHHDLAPARRRVLFERVRRVARRRRLVLVLSGAPRLAAAWRADGAYGPIGARAARPLLRLATAHDAAELVAARRDGADAVLLSPVFLTRSHPGGAALGRARFRLLTRQSAVPVIALGGMDAARFRALGCYGWAGIDAFGVRT